MKKKSIFLLIILQSVLFSAFSQIKEIHENNIPFSTDTSHITIWNGEEYIPFFIKGMNLGVAIPGKFPGEIQVTTKAQYSQWFNLIKDAGYNCIRLYTLHNPYFYEVLDSFNNQNIQNPLYFFQGVWLEEELEGYNQDLYFLSDFFSNEIEENIDCVHGNRIIPARLGKAWGEYTVDASEWLIGYIIGRETQPNELLVTNENHASISNFIGNHLSIMGCSASEAWVTARLNHTIDYENQNYENQHPVSYSSWPTLDPFEHVDEMNEWEDTVSLDLANIDKSNAPAGVFISYHAYPYYPDFISEEIQYQQFSDIYGQNSYLGYITNLKNHYNNFPLIIAEYGVPSSWGVAHYTTNGMNHGGQNQVEQGETDIRLLKNIETADCGGGIQFSWMDEWFKRTWITDPIDYLTDRRVLWHNVTAAEQNFGVIEFKISNEFETLGNYLNTNDITEIKASADYTFLYLTLKISEPFVNLDEMWIGLDTYDATLGESILPDGNTITNRAEFALHITNYEAKLYVTEAYDLFGIWHGTSADNQLYHSIATDGSPWNLVRWKNNNGDEDVQYIGNMKVNQSFFPASSEDAITVYNDSITIRIPWSLIQFVDPSEFVVFDDNRSTPEPESRTSDGISFSIFYKDFSTETSRFLWEPWNTALNVTENQKTSYLICKNRLSEFNIPAFAVSDSINTENQSTIVVSNDNGILTNDFDMDGNYFEAFLLETTPNGILDLNIDGSFTYSPNSDFSGIDVFSYCLYDGYDLSNSANVYLYVENPSNIIAEKVLYNNSEIQIFPNPVHDFINLNSDCNIIDIQIFNSEGKQIFTSKVESESFNLDISTFKSGIYFVKIVTFENTSLKKIIKN